MISFASHDFYKSQQRLAGEFAASGLFNRIISYKQTDLNGTEFLAHHRQFIVRNRRGFGYWIWKPYLIGRTLAAMNDGEWLYYSDSGCTLETGPDAVAYMEKFATGLEAAQQPIHAITESEHPIGKLCKADVLDPLYADCREVETGRLIIRKCPESVAFIEKWAAAAIADNYHNIDDTPSRQAERPEFIEHRHDQSIFSILWYRAGYSILPESEYIARSIWRATRLRDD